VFCYNLPTAVIHMAHGGPQKLAWGLIWIPCLILKGLVSGVLAGILLGDNWSQRLTYIYYVTPWWLHNKLSVREHYTLPIMKWLTDDARLLSYVEHHDITRTRSWEATDPAIQAEWNPTLDELSLYGGSIVTQYMMYGEDVDREPHDQEFVSAVAHLVDDFDDQSEDKRDNNFNYFVNVKSPQPIDDWLIGLKEINDRHRKTPLGQLLRGSLRFATHFGRKQPLTQVIQAHLPDVDLSFSAACAEVR